MRGLGTLINVVTIVAGTGVGVLVGGRLLERIRTTTMQAVALVVVVIGVDEASGTRNVVFPLVGLVVGGVLGELLRLEDRLEDLGDRVRRRFGREENAAFVEGFVAATLVFAVGPLAILGAIDDGLSHDPQLLIVKAALDGLVAIVFASTMGIGVGCSALPVGLYQGTITLLAGAADRALDERMLLEMTAAGGVMVMAIGVRLLDLVRIRVASLIPALFITPVAVALFAR